MSVRLHFVVEGQTEETYANRVLVPHLSKRAVWADARCVATGRKYGRFCRGGICDYGALRKDLILWMKQDDHPHVFFTTMVDLYGLASLRGPFPRWGEASKVSDPYERVALLERAWAEDIGHPRFMPYLQLHEFEALLLASPAHLQLQFVGRELEIGALVEMARGFASPEQIDDDPETCPSRRIIEKLPQYEGLKASAGPIIAERIGLELLRDRCRHFGEWLCKLELLGG